MMQKELASRIVHKHDIETNWNKATTFIPKQGEMIVYDIDDLHDYERIKIGDGVTAVTELPFYQENVAYINASDNETITDPEVESSSISVDSYLSNTSTNPVQNKVVTAELSTLSEQISEYSTLTLGVHTDGLVYIFKNGAPVGIGINVGTDGDVVGYVDENNNIIVTGNLADGSYSVKYEMENGTVIDIGDLVLDTNVYYSVTNNLTNCVNSNSATQAVQGESYAATITANDGYELKSVSVTMGGEAVSASGGSINIAEVTGNIVITAVAEEIKAAEPITVDIALTKGKRIGSDGTLRDQAGYSITDDIDLTSIPKPCTIHLTGSRWAYANTTDTGYVQYYTKKADGTKLRAGYTDDSDDFDQFTIDTNNGDITDVTVTIKSDEVAFIRLCGHHTYNNCSFVNAKATLTYTPKS